MEEGAQDFPNRSPDLAYEVGKDKLAIQLEAIDELDNTVSAPTRAA